MANKSIVPAKFTEKAREIYLSELMATGRKHHSARVAGVCNMTVLSHIADDEEFAQQVNAALEIYQEDVRREVRRRGIEGWLEPVFNKDASQGFTVALDENGEPVMEEIQEALKGPDGLPTGEFKITRRPKLVPAFVRKYSDRMLELEAKRVDPTYRDKSQVDLNVTGGLLVVPGTAPSQRDWENEP